MPLNYFDRAIRLLSAIPVHWRTGIWCVTISFFQILRKSIPAFSFLYFPQLFLFALITAESGTFMLHYIVRKSALPFSLSTDARHFLSVIILLSISFFILFSLMTHGMYRAFTYEWFDIGLFNQAIWNSAHGHILEITDPSLLQNRNWPNVSMLSGHAEWILLFIAPLLHLTGNPELLLFTKTFLLTASIFIVYQTAAYYLTSAEGFAVTLLYILFTPFHFIVLKDFNADPLAIPLIFAAYLFYVKKRKVIFWICLLLALSCKEYVSFVCIALGCILIVRFKDRKHGLTAICIGILYFCFCYFWLNPRFNPTPHATMLSLHFSQFGGDQGFSGLIRYILQHPLQIAGKLISNSGDLFYLLFPLLFLPLLDRSFIIALIILLPKDCLSGMNISSHRMSLVLPFIFWGFIHFLRDTALTRHRKHILFYCLIASVTAAFFYGPTPLGLRFWKETYKYLPDEKDTVASEFISEIPDGVPVSVSPSFTVRLGHRRIIYRFPELGQSADTTKYARYVLIDTADGAYSWIKYRDCNFDSVTSALSIAGYSVVKKECGIYLFSGTFKLSP